MIGTLPFFQTKSWEAGRLNFGGLLHANFGEKLCDLKFDDLMRDGMAWGDGELASSSEEVVESSHWKLSLMRAGDSPVSGWNWA